MLPTYRRIREACRQGDIEIEPFEERRIQPATYDLGYDISYESRIGDQGATTTTKQKVKIKDAGFLLPAPGDFAVVTALETIKGGGEVRAAGCFVT